MEYDNRISKVMNNGEKRCPFCNSLNIKEYLYGEPTSDYDRDRYVLGGSEITLNSPKYKCSDCGKDIYVSKNVPNISITREDNSADNNEYILISYRNKDCLYNIKLSKNKTLHAGIEEYISSICLEKIDYNSVYKIDGVQHLDNEDFDKYYNIIMRTAYDWSKEFDNNELVSDSETIEWSLIVKTKNNSLSFSNNKVPNNMNEFKSVIIELENLYKQEFEKRRKQISNKFDNIFSAMQQKNEELENNKKGYLKREDFINLANSDKIWSKSMTLSEVKELLDLLEKEITKYDYESDKNFVMDGRRNGLKTSIEERLSNSNENTNEKVLESLFNFWEFVNNEYCVPSFDTMERLHLSGDEILKMWDEYKKSGIICFEEKNVILEMIQMIKKIGNIKNIA